MKAGAVTDVPNYSVVSPQIERMPSVVLINTKNNGYLY